MMRFLFCLTPLVLTGCWLGHDPNDASSSAYQYPRALAAYEQSGDAQEMCFAAGYIDYAHKNYDAVVPADERKRKVVEHLEEGLRAADTQDESDKVVCTVQLRESLKGFGLLPRSEAMLECVGLDNTDNPPEVVTFTEYEACKRETGYDPLG